MNIQYVDELPTRFQKQAAELFLAALGEKLAPILGTDYRARRSLRAGMNPARCLAAILPDGRLLGVLAIHTAEGGFIEPTFADLRENYGLMGAIGRLTGLSTLAHTTHRGTWHLEGLAVQPACQGQGVGSRLLQRFHALAEADATIHRVTLQVVDTNARARALYERHGYQIDREESAWPMNRIVGWPFSKVATLSRSVAVREAN